MCHAQLNHVAGAYKQDVGVFDVFKDTVGQPNTGSRHAHRVRSNIGGRANFFGDCKRTLKKLVQRAAQCAGVGGEANCIFELAQNLSLTQNHGVKTAGNSEGVAR